VPEGIEIAPVLLPGAFLPEGTHQACSRLA
jgi:hypothetical protein